jgi:hypothetical protein
VVLLVDDDQVLKSEERTCGVPGPPGVDGTRRREGGQRQRRYQSDSCAELAY